MTMYRSLTTLVICMELTGLPVSKENCRGGANPITPNVRLTGQLMATFSGSPFTISGQITSVFQSHDMTDVARTTSRLPFPRHVAQWPRLNYYPSSIRELHQRCRSGNLVGRHNSSVEKGRQSPGPSLPIDL